MIRLSDITLLNRALRVASRRIGNQKPLPRWVKLRLFLWNVFDKGWWEMRRGVSKAGEIEERIRSRAVLHKIYEKELMGGKRLPEDDWNEMLQDDEWLRVSLIAMHESYKRGQIKTMAQFVTFTKEQISVLQDAVDKLGGRGLHCADCGLEYGGDAWIEAVIPDNYWNQIRPEGTTEGAGILCISCIAKRLTQKGLKDVPVWLCGTEPLKAIEGDPSDSIDLLRSKQGVSLKKE